MKNSNVESQLESQIWKVAIKYHKNNRFEVALESRASNKALVGKTPKHPKEYRQYLHLEKKDTQEM